MKPHYWQAGKLADTGVDFLLAATLPAFSEATGLALALAATAKPYVLSFVVRPEGTMLDGTPLGYDSSPTVELTWALILASVRHIIAENLSLRSGGWQLAIGDGLRGKTLDILGLGNIGSEIARVGLAFGMEVIAWSENLTPERAQAQGARLVSKDELFQHADILTIHLVLSRRTRGLVGAAELAAMKPSARLVNTSRGPIVQEAALIEALGQRKIAGAAIDVFDVEPLPSDHPYRSLENALATPHIGYVSRELFRTFYGDTVRNIAAWLDQRAKATERTSSI
jgi:phosphoglycerate dehydrogenase-like enzyme